MKLGDEHAHDRCQGDEARHEVELVEVDCLPIDGAGLGTEECRDVQMRMVWPPILSARLPVIDQQLSFIPIKETVSRRHTPARTLSPVRRLDDGKAMLNIEE